MNLTEWIAPLLGLEQTQTIDKVEPALASRWVAASPAWLLFGCLAAVAVAVVFYTRYQQQRRRRPRIVLALFRAVLLCLLLVLLAEPVLTVRITSRLRPSLWLLFDGTDSMAIADDLPESERARLAGALKLVEPPNAGTPGSPSGVNPDNPSRPGPPGGPAPSGDPSPSTVASARLSRIDYVKALLRKTDSNLLDRLKKKFRLRAFLFDRPDGVRALDLSSAGNDENEKELLAEQLTTEGQMTALGAALIDLSRQHVAGNVAGLVVFSDFNQNSGPPVLEAASRLGLPTYTVGVGPVGSVDLAVDLQVPPMLKKDERSTLVATLRQEGLAGQTAVVKFSVRKLSGETAVAASIGQKSVKLAGTSQTVELPYVPTETGQFLFAAEVEPLDNEVVSQNNRAERESLVRDDYIRLLFVEYEPTWEWRFVKEVFHRDKLVGMRGFRTFLRSADPRVRQTNELFWQTLSPTRAEFFATDVIILGDMPAAALTPRFCQMTEEFVGKFGGGLVLLAGPRFGPGQLAETPLADLLPVKVDPGMRLRDRQPFVLRRTPDAAQMDFMQLGSTDAENDKAWGNLGPLPWYQPVERLHPLATALAEHPSDTVVDGKSRQPIIAVRPYGRAGGEVVYVGFDELWRLRRSYGEQYYRQFWGQLIHRLALRHALGSQKRFVVRTDRKQYQPDDQVLLTVEAYDANFEPLGEDKVPDRRLTAVVYLPEGRGPGNSTSGTLSVSQLRQGVYESRFPVFAAGEHRIRVKDPITGQFAEVTFRVASVSAERQRAVRNVALQQALADTTAATSYDLANVDRLVDDVKLQAKTESSVEVIPLWDTWLSFGLIVLLMLGEWLGRKWVNLP